MNLLFNKTTIPLLIIFFLFGIGFSYLFFMFDQNRIQGSWQTRSTFSYLFVFEDEDSNYLFGQVLVYNSETQKSFFIDLPAETAYEEKNSTKISWLSNLYKQDKAEAFLTRIGTLLGETVDFYVILNKKQLSQTVDILSGVPLFINESVEVKREGQLPLLIPSGLIILDGEKSNDYLSYFAPLPYHEERQDFLQSYFNQWFIYKEFLQEKEVSRIFFNFLKSNIYSPIFLDFLLDKWVSPLDSNLAFYIKGPIQKIVEENIEIIFPTSLSGENLLREQMRRGLRYINDYNRLDDISVEVLNSTGKVGLAKKVAEFLEYQGYKIIRVGNADKMGERTTLINNKGNLSKVRIFSDLFRIDNIKNIINEENPADITIILGSDFDENTIYE